MMKRLIFGLVMVLMLAGCANSKKAANKTQGMEYVAEEVELVGYGYGESTDWGIARGKAMDMALGDLSRKMDAKVRTASSTYQKELGEITKVLYESLTEVISENHLQGVQYKGDRNPVRMRGNKFVFNVEARINHTLFRETAESVLNRLDVTENERDAFRRTMFGR